MTEEDLKRMEKLERIGLAVIAAVLLLIGVAIGWQLCLWTDRTRADVTTDTIYIDRTHVVRAPMARTEKVLGLERVPLVCYVDTSKMPDESQADTVVAELPVVQKAYGDSTYMAWVSGYGLNDYPRLDSISVTQRTEVVTRTIAQSRKPWGVGVMAGYGMGRDGFMPFIGVGVQYRLWGF